MEGFFGISLSLLCVEEKWLMQEVNAFMGAFAIYNFEVKLHALPVTPYTPISHSITALCPDVLQHNIP